MFARLAEHSQNKLLAIQGFTIYAPGNQSVYWPPFTATVALLRQSGTRPTVSLRACTQSSDRFGYISETFRVHPETPKSHKLGR